MTTKPDPSRCPYCRNPLTAQGHPNGDHAHCQAAWDRAIEAAAQVANTRLYKYESHASVVAGILRLKSPEGGEPNLDTCPSCGGPADNGHDRCVPPNAYNCSKCSGTGR